MVICIAHSNEQISMARWSTEALSIPITCLHIIDEHILIGEGGSVYCYQLDGGPKLSQLTVFRGARVYGVVQYHPEHGAPEGQTPNCSSTAGGLPAEPRQLIIYGGKQLCLVSLDNKGCLRPVRPAVLLGGWLLDVAPLSDGLLGALDAHGRLLRLTADISQQAAPPVRCPDRCILYSGALLAPTCPGDCLLAFCGTVFCQVLIWAPGEDGGDGPILHRLTGHTGVLFRLGLNPALDTLISCSDDRSVRLWRRSGGDWRRAAPTPAGTLFGHEARVWAALSAGAHRRTVSVGEDSRVCVWSADGCLERRWRAHAGASVRAAAADAAGRRLVTGGGDGAVLVWPLWGPAAPPDLLPAPAADTVRSLLSLDGRRQLLVTAAGRLVMTRRGDDGGGVTTEQVLQDARLASYALLAAGPAGRQVALATRHGHVITLATDGDCLVKTADWQPLDGKIYSLHWLDTERLLVCGGDGQLQVVPSDPSVVGAGAGAVRCHQLPAGKQRWVSAAALCPPETLVVADRDGSLHVFQPGQLKPVQTLRRLVGRHGATSITRTDDVTSTRDTLPLADGTTAPCRPDAEGATETCLLVTARDGTARHLRLTADGLLQESSCLRLPWDWVAGVTRLAGEATIIGFHANQLVLWSVAAEREVWRVNCGGGHRSWALSVSERRLWLSWVAEGSVRHVTCPLDRLRTTVIMPGVQGGGTLSACELGAAPDGGTLLALAGQDGTVRLVSAGRHSLRPLSTLRGHISAVRAVCSAGAGHLVSAGGRGQVLLWRLTDGGAAALQLSDHRVRPESRRRATAAADTPETRYMDLAARRQGATVTVAAAGSDGLVRLLGFCPESASPRLSLLAAVPVADRCLLRLRWLHSGQLVVSGTDGAVWLCPVRRAETDDGRGATDRRETTEQSSPGVVPESGPGTAPESGPGVAPESGPGVVPESGRVTGQQPGQDCGPASERGVQPGQDQESTKEPTPEPSGTERLAAARLAVLHQSGVNALEVLRDESAGESLLTGGDDGALCLSRLTTDGQLVTGPRRVPAHASQITGVGRLPSGRLLSVSVDQRLCVWQHQLEENLLSCVSCHLTSVADAKGLLHWTDRHGRTLALVYGEGVELLTLDLDRPAEPHLIPQTAAAAGNS